MLFVSLTLVAILILTLYEKTSAPPNAKSPNIVTYAELVVEIPGIGKLHLSLPICLCFILFYVASVSKSGFILLCDSLSGSESPLRAVDVNGNSVLDVIVGFTTAEGDGDRISPSCTPHLPRKYTVYTVLLLATVEVNGKQKQCRQCHLSAGGCQGDRKSVV